MAYLFIDLELNATPITGHITSDQDVRRPFHGWLELSSAIERRRTGGVTTAAMAARPVERMPTATDDDPVPTSTPVPNTLAPRSNAPSDGQSGSFHHRRVGGWLAQSNQPRWMLLGAWTCAGWSAAAVPVLAATRHTRVIAWWALGLLVVLVLLIHVWTEQRPAANPQDRDEPPSRHPRPPCCSDNPPTGIDWQRLEQEILTLPPSST